jgi:hypothetical protein
MTIVPPEDNAVLVVDSDGMKSCIVANQLFKVIPRWNTKIKKLMSGVDHIQLPLRN